LGCAIIICVKMTSQLAIISLLGRMVVLKELSQKYHSVRYLIQLLHDWNPMKMEFKIQLTSHSGNVQDYYL
jgi:hypothetical protein